MPTLTRATTDAHFEQILALQRRNHRGVVPADAQSSAGFVFVEHTLPVLRRLAAASPQAIALADDRVVGYCLSMTPAVQADVPVLAPMFAQFERCEVRGRPLAQHRYVVGGQVCVDHAFRGQGLLAKLYGQVRAETAGQVDLCVTEIATRNEVSVRSHLRMGFAPLKTYVHADEEWVIVAWDFAN